MKKLYTLVVFSFCFSALQAQITIWDNGMVAALTAAVPNAMNGNVLDETHPDVTGFAYPDILDVSNYGIYDLNGLQYFTQVETVYCSDNNITDLSPLPPNCHEIWCMRNPLTELHITTQLGWVEAAQCPIESLTIADPSGLFWLSLYDSPDLHVIPDLPEGMDSFLAVSCGITEIGSLPSTLGQLYLNGNPDLTCLPDLPAGLQLDVVGTGITCLPNMAPGVNSNPPLPICNDIIGNCVDANLFGSVFNDTNNNGIQDVGELTVPGQILEVQPGGYTLSTGSDGQFELYVPVGSYTVTAIPYAFQTITTAPINVVVPDTSTNITGLDHGIYYAPGQQDLNIDLVSSADPRPGFERTYTVSYSHPAPQITSGTVTVAFDPIMEWISSDPAPDTQNGNTATWNYSNIAFGTGGQIEVVLKTPIGTTLGTLLQHTASIGPLVGDLNPDDNTSILEETVIGSYDPNDKLVSPSFMEEAEVQAGNFIDYTIRFQNTGTADAIDVRISDILPEGLQWNTFEFVSSSHPVEWQKQEQFLSFLFENINLPDSNANEPESHGFVKFRIMPNTDLVSGDVVANYASIYFDFNSPIVTEDAVFAVSKVQVRLHAFLGGPFDGNSRMEDDLRDNGLIPLTEPYSALGYSPVGPQSTTVAQSVLNNSSAYSAIVDWVLVELRDKNDPSLVVASKYALIQRDGDVRDTTGTNSGILHFESMPPDDYYIIIWHRNHLAVMTATPQTLGHPLYELDFSDPSTEVWGTDAQQLVNGKMVLWPGDVNANGQIKYTGLNNDRDPILIEIGGQIPTNTTTGYKGEDVNMDGIIKYTGADNDRDPILQTIGGTVPTAVRYEQVP